MTTLGVHHFQFAPLYGCILLFHTDASSQVTFPVERVVNSAAGMCLLRCSTDCFDTRLRLTVGRGGLDDEARNLAHDPAWVTAHGRGSVTVDPALKPDPELRLGVLTFSPMPGLPAVPVPHPGTYRVEALRATRPEEQWQWHLDTEEQDIERWHVAVDLDHRHTPPISAATAPARRVAPRRSRGPAPTELSRRGS